MTEFKVFDTGMGISEKNIDRIFDSFRQANNQVKSKFGGTGLGLAIVKQLVNLHGGDISVESTLGEGTVFNFTLPLKDSGEKPKQISKIVKQLSADWKEYKVLVVEDNLINQKYVEGLMQKWDIPFVIASDGKTTLQNIDNQIFDLILMDIVLPDTDGYILTKTIRNKEGNANQNIPIVALSATALNEEIEVAYAAGMNDYLTKPFRPEQLREIIEKNLKNIKPKVGTIKTSESVENQSININIKKMYGDDAGYALHMLKLFSETIPNEVQSLKQFLEEENIEKVGRLVHQIKPSYTMVGLPEMTERLQIIEKAIKQGAKLSQVKDAILEFIYEDTKTLELLEKEIAKLK